ncbi:ImmA/IrrE family metallo-endopeptidase [Ornithinibacillus sp. JPR2-1]|uniref:ImmA/IrrE family metallo-endopeptidase n=1 Tax=Ornithinibacillus sp. JPR2-1 TaxID=2094019 RepID=UPI0031E241BC
MYTHIEDYIKELYTVLSISKPEQLDIKTIASKLGVNLLYGKATFRDGNDIVIKRSTQQKEWQIFGHEICHYLRHCGQQLKMHYLFRELQEYQANHFAYHFCVPTFMLDELKIQNATEIMKNFNVEYDFALKRLEMYQSKFYYLGGNYGRSYIV